MESGNTIFVSDDVTASFETSNTVTEPVWLLLITACVHCTLTNVTAGCFMCFCQTVRITFHSPTLAKSTSSSFHIWITSGKISTVDMSTAVQVEPVMERRYGGVGRCKCSFWFAVAHDILGIFIMLVGVFGGLVIHDLFIYAGAIIIFLSLIWWVFWYSGNIDVPPEELEDDVGLIKLKNRRLRQVARRVSDHLSNRIRNSFRKNGRSFREGNNRPSNTGTDVSLSTICDNTIASSSKELVRETLSI